MFGFSKYFIFFTIFSMILFAIYPKIDLYVSSLFFDPHQGFYLGELEPFIFMHDYVRWIFFIPFLVLIILYIYQFVTKNEFKKFNKRAIFFVLIFSIVGPGIVTNLIIKEHSTRARPINIDYFGSKSGKEFTPYYSLKGKCKKNCSFISGHVAATFIFLAIAYILKSRLFFIFSIALLILMAVSRIVQGGHFLSDTIFTFIINLIILNLIYYLVFKEYPTLKEKS